MIQASKHYKANILKYSIMHVPLPVQAILVSIRLFLLQLPGVDNSAFDLINLYLQYKPLVCPAIQLLSEWSRKQTQAVLLCDLNRLCAQGYAFEPIGLETNASRLIPVGRLLN